MGVLMLCFRVCLGDASTHLQALFLIENEALSSNYAVYVLILGSYDNLLYR